jgi:hypothetical protein
MITTAEEFYLKETGWESLDSFEEFDHPKDVVKYMVEFAKYHIEQALQEAYKKADLEYYGDEVCYNKESILNAYPLTNVK